MLTNDQLNIIGETLTPLFQYLEQEVIADIARRIKQTMSYTRTAELQAISMKELGYSPAKIRSEVMKMLNADPNYRKAVAKNTLEYKREVRKIIEEITREAYKQGDDILANAGNMSWVNDLEVWKQAGNELTDKSYLPKLIQAITDNTHGALSNITGTTGFKAKSGYESIENAYKRELDKAIIKLSSGAFTSDQVIRDSVKELSQSGLRSIDYANGYSMQIDTAVSLAVRTASNQLSGNILDQNISRSGQNLVYVEQHEGARNKGVGVANHEQWQGKVYYVKDNGTDYTDEAQRIGQKSIDNLWEKTGYSVDGSHENNPAGLHGYNCRHLHHVWFDGISELPSDIPDRPDIEWNGKVLDYYAQTQKMRSMERAIRNLKREKDALKNLGMDATDTDHLIRVKRAEYVQFCSRCKTTPNESKLRYQSGTSDITKTDAYKSYKNMYNK